MALFFRRIHRYHKGSVLPRVVGTRTPQGQRLIVNPTTRGDVVRLIFIGVLVAFMFWLVWMRGLHGPRTGRILGQLVTAGSFFIGSVAEFIRQKRLHRALLLVRPWPIRLGDEVHAELRAFVRHHASAVDANLECVEEATLNRGRRFEEKHSSTIYAEDLETHDLESKRRIVTAAWTFTIPDQLPPSFDAASNVVRWRLAVTIKTEIAEVPVPFVLVVVPEMAR